MSYPTGEEGTDRATLGRPGDFRMFLERTAGHGISEDAREPVGSQVQTWKSLGQKAGKTHWEESLWVGLADLFQEEESGQAPGAGLGQTGAVCLPGCQRLLVADSRLRVLPCLWSELPAGLAWESPLRRAEAGHHHDGAKNQRALVVGSQSGVESITLSWVPC